MLLLPVTLSGSEYGRGPGALRHRDDDLTGCWVQQGDWDRGRCTCRRFRISKTEGLNSGHDMLRNAEIRCVEEGIHIRSAHVILNA